MSKSRKKEPYYKSVRFYKHVIIVIIGLMIFVPTVLCVILGLRVAELSSANNDLKDEMVLMEHKMEELMDIPES